MTEPLPLACLFFAFVLLVAGEWFMAACMVLVALAVS